MLEYLVSKGHSLKTLGHIGFSPKKKNSIVSHVWGAAAYNGQLSLLKSLYRVYGTEIDIELKSDEKKGLIGGVTLQKEVFGFTPLMLAVVAGGQNVDVVRWMIEDAECNTSVKDWQESTLLHLAVRYNCKEIVSYLICASLIDPFQRNLIGETAVSIAQTPGFGEISKILSLCKDNSGQKMEELLNMINEEEERKEKKKKKKADKRKKKRKASMESKEDGVAAGSKKSNADESAASQREVDEEIVEIGEVHLDPVIKKDPVIEESNKLPHADSEEPPNSDSDDYNKVTDTKGHIKIHQSDNNSDNYDEEHEDKNKDKIKNKAGTLISKDKSTIKPKHVEEEEKATLTSPPTVEHRAPKPAKILADENKKEEVTAENIKKAVTEPEKIIPEPEQEQHQVSSKEESWHSKEQYYYASQEQRKEKMRSEYNGSRRGYGPTARRRGYYRTSRAYVPKSRGPVESDSATVPDVVPQETIPPPAQAIHEDLKEVPKPPSAPAQEELKPSSAAAKAIITDKTEELTAMIKSELRSSVPSSVMSDQPAVLIAIQAAPSVEPKMAQESGEKPEIVAACLKEEKMNADSSHEGEKKPMIIVPEAVSRLSTEVQTDAVVIASSIEALEKDNDMAQKMAFEFAVLFISHAY